jgi:hypothetical protein
VTRRWIFFGADFQLHRREGALGVIFHARGACASFVYELEPSLFLATRLVSLSLSATTKVWQLLRETTATETAAL